MTLDPDWFPEHTGGTICPRAQARLYPYPAPSGDFWMRNGLPELRPDGITADELAGRTAVISVGSNRAPLQLRRKFGLEAELPVTACVLKDCDVVYAATLSYYCAAPATACPSPGTSVTLNITWLDDAQLLHMHDTEALGIAYDFVRLDDGCVDHGRRQGGAVFDQPVYGYQSRSGLYAPDGEPLAHALIPAEGRRFDAVTEDAVLTRIKAMAGKKMAGKKMAGAEDQPLDDWLDAMRADRQLRLQVMARMNEVMMPLPLAPWQVMDVAAANPDEYL
ncbi:MAG: hypothetical protein J4F41_03160 [Alphaproteobacteria bacterium]|nr:hypothetical protein [Alphaproteobacteria bacterium]